MKLSIITINKNNAHGLEKTIQSVVSQTYKDFEYLLIDGASADGSVEIIKKYSSQINFWVSEPDTGIYNAMNKGIRKAQGEYCLFLNSGDCLVSSATLQDVFNEIGNMAEADIFYSDCIKTDANNIYYPKSLTINNLIRTGLSHQNSLIKRSLFLEHGFYNEKLTIASDQEFFFFEAWKYKSKFLRINTNISIFDANGIGSQNTPQIYAEGKILYQNVFQELSETILEFASYRRTIYYHIVRNYGNTRLLDFILKIYGFLISRINKIMRFLYKDTTKGTIYGE
jgi:glycosyltransferase involved in cell wall biosynthesis